MPPWTGQAARTGGVAPPRPAERWYSGWVRRSFDHGETFTLMSMQVPAPPRTGRVMRIGELSRRTGVPARMLRYYEEQDLLPPERAGNGYRSYSLSDLYRVQQIRGLLDSGLTTEIIRGILPFLDDPNDIRPPNASPHKPRTCCGVRQPGSSSASTA